MKIGSPDVAIDGTVSSDKSITTESGNPWGTFIDNAQETIGGDPSDIVLDEALIRLEPTSTNIDDLGEIFDGRVTLQFEMNSSKNIVTVADGTISGQALGTEALLMAEFDYLALPEDDVNDLMSGSFKVILAGMTAADFATLDADADLSIILTFSAFE